MYLCKGVCVRVGLLSAAVCWPGLGIPDCFCHHGSSCSCNKRESDGERRPCQSTIQGAPLQHQGYTMRQTDVITSLGHRDTYNHTFPLCSTHSLTHSHHGCIILTGYRIPKWSLFRLTELLVWHIRQKSFLSFRVYFRDTQPTEYAQQCFFRWPRHQSSRSFHRFYIVEMSQVFKNR